MVKARKAHTTKGEENRGGRPDLYTPKGGSGLGKLE